MVKTNTAPGAAAPGAVSFVFFAGDAQSCCQLCQTF